jgi:hypothetical protein
LSVLLRSCLVLVLAGCGGAPPPSREAASTPSDAPAKLSSEAPPDSTPTRKARFEPVELGQTADRPKPRTGRTGSTPKEDSHSTDVVTSLQPFQILLGKWRFVTKKKFGEFPKTGDDLEWIWDFQSDRKLPSLTATSDSHPYLKQAWLTFLPDENQFQITLVDRAANRRILCGTWTDGGEPRVEYDGKTQQRAYKLLLTQTMPTEGEQWQIVFSQLDNNQFLVDFKKRAPASTSFGSLDTVRQQRVGTSFAVADSDNPGPKCIISGGLGSMSVSYKGKSYPVCCSGCAAAFNDDPERWLAKLSQGDGKNPADE